MAWSRKKTINILIYVSLISFAFAIVSITLILYNLLKKKEHNQYFTSFLYLIASTFGSGTGCIWFRIFKADRTWTHALIHLISLICMLVAHRETFELIFDGEIDKCFSLFPISIFLIIMYIMQIIVALCFSCCRWGRTPAQKAFNTGLHDFIGANILFVSITNGILVCNKISRDVNRENKISFHIAAVLIFLYGMTVWYIILNPYFDWRRLQTLVRVRTSKTNISNRKQSKK